MKQKKYVPILLLLIILCIVAIFTITKILGNGATKKTENSTENVVKTTSETEMAVLDSGKNYKVYDLTENDNPKYAYEIYNSDGKIVDNGEVERSEPFFKYYSDTLLSVSFAGGTGPGAVSTLFYDVESDNFSESFWAVFDARDNKVLYMDDNTGLLVVRDIFDKAKYIKEFELDLAEQSIASNLIEEAKFINDSEVKVTYLAGEDGEEKTTTLQLD